MEDDILILTNDDGKRCVRCGRFLPLSHFYRSRRAKDTYQSYCIHCERDYKHDRRLERLANETEAFGVTTMSELIEKAPAMDAKTRRDIIRIIERTLKELKTIK